MTNPTSPLTAEERFRLAKIWNMSDASMSQLNAEDDISFLLCLVRKMELAAQQNAELVATISQLNSDIAGLKSQLKDAEINFKALADGTIRDEAIGMLRAENERLKTAEQSYCRRISFLEKDIKSFQRSAAIRDTKLAKAKAHADLMQAENERLKQQLADVEKVCKPHKRMGAGGCDAMSEGRRQAKNELAKQVLAIIQPPKEAT